MPTYGGGEAAKQGESPFTAKMQLFIRRLSVLIFAGFCMCHADLGGGGGSSSYSSFPPTPGRTCPQP
jgi:hypothetical protein